MKILIIIIALIAAGINTFVLYCLTVVAGRVDKALGYKDKEDKNGA